MKVYLVRQNDAGKRQLDALESQSVGKPVLLVRSGATRFSRMRLSLSSSASAEDAAAEAAAADLVPAAFAVLSSWGCWWAVAEDAAAEANSWWASASVAEWDLWGCWWAVAEYATAEAGSWWASASSTALGHSPSIAQCEAHANKSGH